MDPDVVAPWPWAFVLAALLLAIVAWRQRPQNQTLAGTDKPPRVIHSLGSSIPLLGDFLEVAKHSQVRYDWLWAQSVRFNYEPWQICIPGTASMIVVSNPSAAEAVTTKHFSTFNKGEQHIENLHDLFGNGLVSSDGDQWFHQRKTAAKFFSAKTLRLMMMHTMQKNMSQVYGTLDAACAHGAAPANLTLLLHQFTLQTFLEVGVGISYPMIGKTEPHPFEKALDDTAPLITRRGGLPPLQWKLERWLGVGPERKLKESMAVIHEHIQDMITQSLSAKREPEAETETQEKIRSAIDLFIEHSSEDKAGLRPRDLVDFVLNFVIGARDTSSVTMQYFMYALSKHPQVEAKIREEMATKIGSLGVKADGYITAEHAKQLVYFEAAIMETLRLYPAGPVVTRQATQDIVIDGDLFIRKNQRVAIPIYAMARNPNIWGPDAADFKPERWIDLTSNELIPMSSTKFFSFSAGPRTCIGMKLAMLNLRVVLVNLLHRYKFHVDPSNDGSYTASVTLMMKHKLLATVERV